jgi:hypothetical protein
MEHTHNNFMKFGGTLGNVQQKLKKKLLLKLNDIFSKNCILENRLTVRIYRVFITGFFFSIFVKRYLVTLLILLG